MQSLSTTGHLERRRQNKRSGDLNRTEWASFVGLLIGSVSFFFFFSADQRLIRQWFMSLAWPQKVSTSFRKKRLRMNLEVPGCQQEEEEGWIISGIHGIHGTVVERKQLRLQEGLSRSLIPLEPKTAPKKKRGGSQ
mmetsp:Transcript_30290/g.63271  ORF Transcript_30290/g.63271 Transcript_30290/m.63271 type:complete len:136 (-) Transcript_30290:121-528(-)